MLGWLRRFWVWLAKGQAGEEGSKPPRKAPPVKIKRGDYVCVWVHKDILGLLGDRDPDRTRQEATAAWWHWSKLPADTRAMLLREYLWSGVPQGEGGVGETVYLSHAGLTVGEPTKTEVSREREREKTFLRLLSPSTDEVKIWA